VQDRIEVAPAPARGPVPEVRAQSRPPGETDRLPVTVVVPVFNEEKAIPYLSNTLEEMHRDLGRDYDLTFVFVDDGSTDRTWELLGRHFGADPRCRRVRHDRNQGVAAAILTGIREAKTPVVCSIDCDCTYDPRQLGAMIPKLTDGVDMVTASPYHADGRVLNVPAWRLGLSKGLSFLYRRILNNSLATYTACFRVYRRSAVADLEVAEGGFLGVAEMLGRLDLRGSRISEHPAVLEVRMIGHSKMKVLKTIAGHLGLLGRLAAARVVG
jgi:glycosyltransferase involved in cell wall biosynthesis